MRTTQRPAANRGRLRPDRPSNNKLQSSAKRSLRHGHRGHDRHANRRFDRDEPAHRDSHSHPFACPHGAANRNGPAHDNPGTGHPCTHCGRSRGL